MIRRSDGARDADWIRRTAATVYAELGDYGRIIPTWMGHAGVMTFVEMADEDAGGETRRGFILIGFYEPEPGDLSRGLLVADLLAIAVSPEHQRRGVGRTLLEFAVDVATEASRQAPVREIRLTVAETNRPALALFKNSGFEILDPHHGAYDGGQRALRMRRRISTGASESDTRPIRRGS
jgi:ribosomal protein S18 acetylase RimI-like enzyme